MRPASFAIGKTEMMFTRRAALQLAGAACASLAVSGPAGAAETFGPETVTAKARVPF